MNVSQMALSLALAVVAMQAQAFGGDDKWASGWGQGVAEAIVTRGPGNQIYVTCNDGGSTAASTGISFMLSGSAPSGSHITLTFDRNDPEQIWIVNGGIRSDCRACMANYEYVIGKFKAHSSVHVMFENGDNARFTLKGSRDAISECIPDFAR